MARATLRFGVLQFFGWPDRSKPIGAIYERAVERARVMDAAGYDAIWLAEHHFSGYSVCPSVHMMGVHIAHHTTRLRIGTAVSLASFYHPLRLAEEVALLDIVSGGRVNWGAGRGFDPIEFKIFGVPVEESGKRFHEAVETVLAAWKQERLSWTGPYWSFEDVEVLPKPLQQPHPPVWLAAGSEGAIRWAAKRGFAILLGPHSTFAENAQHFQLYESELRGHGHSHESPIPMARFVAVADTDAEAEMIARRGCEWLTGAYINESKSTNPKHAAQAVLMMDRRERIERYMGGAIIHGSPRRVIESIERLQETMHLRYLMVAPLSARTFFEFTDKVMPHFS